MEDIFEIRFAFEQKMKENVIVKFSNKQGGDYNVFSSHWQCFVWAATIGFIRNKRLPLTPPIADKPFSLSTMNRNGGEASAQALLCMCVAKHGNLEILKEPQKAINLINEYANGGFHYILDELNERPLINDLEWVKQEIFSREIQ